MNRTHYLVLTAVLFLSTALFTIFVFIPTVNPYEVVNVQLQTPMRETIEIESLPSLKDFWSMEENTTKIIDAQILNRELPTKWQGKKIFFKYTYIGEYSENTQTILNDLLLNEYKWQKQLDENGNIVFGGIILAKDKTYQLHTHNSYSKGNRYFLLGDLLDNYNSNNELIGTQIRFGNVTLEAKWAKDVKILEENSFSFADLIISTCLERNSYRRLVSGWDIERE